jgi:acyl-CoA synthetase (AMP-forming)/AMP-acid ligase II
VICPPAFDPLELPGWVEAFEPTWYTAAPTIHRAVLEVVEHHPEIAARRSFRFLRSASAPMPPQAIAEMERVFGVPFIEAYGMTEAAPQIASNALPPGRRKRGSVGRPAGPEVAILDGDGRILSAGQTGEVAIRGPSVMRGYEDNPEANRAAFAGDWLRTGDQGYLDDEGYLYINGRLDEIINRGGEKIAPREVDEALLAHPAVAEAASFPVPHPGLGQDVGAAVALRPGMSATVRDLQDFVAQRLADFKVPRRLVIVDAIPRGPTAKLQRRGLAEKLGLSGEAAARKLEGAFVAPRDRVEEAIVRIWGEVLGAPRVGVRDDFFELGGHSLHAIQVIARIRDELASNLGLGDLFLAPTVEAMARAVAAEREQGRAAEIASVLEALEGMSEEEAQRLVEEQAST